MAGGRDRTELLGGSEGDARDDRADDALLAQADERDAERGTSGGGGRAQDLSVLTGVHGAVRAAVFVGGSADHRRVLRHDGGAYQVDPFGSAIAANTDQAGDGGSGRARGEGPGDGQSSGWREEQAGGEDRGGEIRGVRRDPAAAGSGCVEGDRGGEAVRGRRNRLHQCSRWTAGQCADERAGDLPVDPGEGGDRGGAALLLPRPEYPEHSIGAAGRAHGGDP